MRRMELHEVERAAPHAMGEDAGEAHLRALDALAADAQSAISLYVSVPFCAAHCLCCPRPVRTVQPASVIAGYVADVADEAARLAARIGGDRDVLQLHLGGGSAAELGEAALLRLVDALGATFRLPADCEMSVECDPRRASDRQLRLMRSLGFRRVVFGVFDLDPRVQEAIGRVHSRAMLDDACDMARSSGIASLVLGLMVGLPHQTEESWDVTLTGILALGPDRIVLDRYRHEPWRAPTQHAIDAHALPSPAATRALAAQTHRRLAAAGYVAIGDDFVLDSDELLVAAGAGRLRRSLISPTATPPVPLLGLGAGAMSQIDGAVYGHAWAMPVWRESFTAGRSPAVQLRRSQGGSLLRIGECPS